MSEEKNYVVRMYEKKIKRAEKRVKSIEDFFLNTKGSGISNSRRIAESRRLPAKRHQIERYKSIIAKIGA